MGFSPALVTDGPLGGAGEVRPVYFFEIFLGDFFFGLFLVDSSCINASPACPSAAFRSFPVCFFGSVCLLFLPIFCCVVALLGAFFSRSLWCSSRTMRTKTRARPLTAGSTPSLCSPSPEATSKFSVDCRLSHPGGWLVVQVHAAAKPLV